MVTGADRLAGRLGWMLIAGALAGVTLSCGALVALALAGVHPGVWPLTFSGWWSGELWPLRLLAGGGVVLLAATPVAMLLVFGVEAARARRWRTVLAGAGVACVLAAGVVAAIVGGA